MRRLCNGCEAFIILPSIFEKNVNLPENVLKMRFVLPILLKMSLSKKLMTF